MASINKFSDSAPSLKRQTFFSLSHIPSSFNNVIVLKGYNRNFRGQLQLLCGHSVTSSTIADGFYRTPKCVQGLIFCWHLLMFLLILHKTLVMQECQHLIRSGGWVVKKWQRFHNSVSLPFFKIAWCLKMLIPSKSGVSNLLAQLGRIEGRRNCLGPHIEHIL